MATYSRRRRLRPASSAGRYGDFADMCRNDGLSTEMPPQIAVEPTSTDDFDGGDGEETSADNSSQNPMSRVPTPTEADALDRAFTSFQWPCNLFLPQPRTNTPDNATTLTDAQELPRARPQIDIAQARQRLASLIHQAEALKIASENREATLYRQLAKPSPRTRAKRAIAKAARAVKDQLIRSTSSTHSKRSGHIAEDSSDPVWASNSASNAEREVSQAMDSESRRMAEASNLAKVKIQCLTGNDLNFHRPRQLSKGLQPEAPSGLPCMLDESESADSKPRFTKDEHYLKTPDKLPQGSVDLGPECRGPKSGPMFDRMLSGLSQHAQTMSFSAPDDCSTPWGQSRVEDLTLQTRATNDQKTIGSSYDASIRAHLTAKVDNGSPRKDCEHQGQQHAKRKFDSRPFHISHPTSPVTKKVKLTPPTSKPKLNLFPNARTTKRDKSSIQQVHVDRHTLSHAHPARSKVFPRAPLGERSTNTSMQSRIAMRTAEDNKLQPVKGPAISSIKSGKNDASRKAINSQIPVTLESLNRKRRRGSLAFDKMVEDKENDPACSVIQGKPDKGTSILDRVRARASATYLPTSTHARRHRLSRLSIHANPQRAAVDGGSQQIYEMEIDELAN